MAQNKMKDLLECKDLLKNKRVIAACEGLGVITAPCPLEVVAFAMRDACGSAEWLYAMAVVTSFTPAFAPAKHWIIAATLVWESRK